MTDVSPAVARVRMPERGVFAVRCADGICPNAGESVVVALDYGEDMGVALSSIVPPSVPPVRSAAGAGRRVPGFRALRVATAHDVERAAENAHLAKAIAADFAEMVKAHSSVSVRVPHSRLSLGRARLFLRFIAPHGTGGISRQIDELQAKHGIQVNARQIGPREEVALVGAIAPCGRPCCCSTWQTRCPHGGGGVAAERFNGAEQSGKTGVCGCRRCCAAF